MYHVDFTFSNELFVNTSVEKEAVWYRLPGYSQGLTMSSFYHTQALRLNACIAYIQSHHICTRWWHIILSTCQTNSLRALCGLTKRVWNLSLGKRPGVFCVGMVLEETDNDTRVAESLVCSLLHGNRPKILELQVRLPTKAAFLDTAGFICSCYKDIRDSPERTPLQYDI